MQDERLRLLVVDDEVDQVSLLRDLLAASALAGAELIWAGASAEGLDRLATEPFDLALVDYRLDARTGLDVLRAARAQGVATPIVLLTAQTDRRIDVAAMEAGAADFVDKSTLSAAYLERVIRYAVRNARQMEALRASEQRARALIEHASDAILLLDREGAVLFASESFEAVSGIPPSQAIGRDAFERVHPHDRAALRARFEECVAQPGRRMAAEYRGQHGDGTWRHREITAVNRLDDPAVGAIVVSYRDVTDRKRHETEHAHLTAVVQSSEDAYRAIFEDSPIGLAHLSTDGRWLRANARLCEMLSYSHDELTLLTFIEMTHPDDLQGAIRGTRALLEGQTNTHAMEKRYRRGDGEYVWVRIHTTLHRTPDGAPAYLIKAVEDISARKAAEEQHALLEEQFRQAQKMEAIGRLAGGVAHDFNNLLTAIIGYSELSLENEALDGTSRRHLEEIHRAAQSAAGLTTQLLAFSRRQVLQPQVIDLNTIVRRAEFLLRRLIGGDVELRTNLSPMLDPISADPTQMEQIIINLAVNARDAMPHGGRLTIETANAELDANYAARHRGATEGRHVMLTVSDTGVGMDAATQKRLFEPFFTTKEWGRGTGLGLSTVYGIVQQSGGSIWVYSEPGQGTVFKIFLPPARVAAAPASVAPAAARPRLSGRETILVVDDKPEVRAVTHDVLTRQGYTVIEAGTAEEAIACVQQRRMHVDLLFTDIVMPQMNGRDLARQLSAELPGLKVVYTSGYAENTIVQNSVLEPSLAFLPKPFTGRALLAKIREVLDGEPAAGV